MGLVKFEAMMGHPGRDIWYASGDGKLKLKRVIRALIWGDIGNEVIIKTMRMDEIVQGREWRKRKGEAIRQLEG